MTQPPCSKAVPFPLDPQAPGHSSQISERKRRDPAQRRQLLAEKGTAECSVLSTVLAVPTLNPRMCACAGCCGHNTPSFSWLLAEMPSETEPTLFSMQDCIFLVPSSVEDNKAQKRKKFVWGRLIRLSGPSPFLHCGDAASPLIPT